MNSYRMLVCLPASLCVLFVLMQKIEDKKRPHIQISVNNDGGDGVCGGR